MSMPAGYRFPTCRVFEPFSGAMSSFAPASLNELRDAIGDALAAEEPLEVVAGGSKRDLGRPLQLPRTLDLSRLCGIREYQPSELVLTAGAATPVEEMEAALTAAGQMLAFEPPDWGDLLGATRTVAQRRTLGGVLACNLSGPRRIKSGAARDHFLGFRGVSGRGEIFKAGGKVVKNVTGYDLCKLMAGSYGTLAALEEVTVKVLPRPETAATVVVCGLDAVAAVRCLSRLLGSPHEISGAAYVPPPLTFGALEGVRGAAALRLEGPAPSVTYRCARLLADLARHGEALVLDEGASMVLWQEIRDVSPFAARDADRAVWRLSVPPSHGAAVAEEIARHLDADWYLDWGGGLVWVAVPAGGDGGAAAIRAAIRGRDKRGTGHATLIRGSPALRRTVPVFEPQPPALAALAARIKDGFDPRRILNPGRMVDGS
jgi:glycolate oxidase FAD binding subunit